MHLKRITLVQFKNYTENSIELIDGINCFVGRNGAGKTNILDAVYYTSMCRSYLNPVDSQNIAFDEQFFIIQSIWEKNHEDVEVYCGVKRGQKKVFKRNKVDYERLADHIGQFPTVMISPYDADLISEGSEVRRKWMDGIISQFDKVYLDVLIRYNALLEQRNALLKNIAKNGLIDSESLEVWDEQLVALGLIIHEKRKLFLEKIEPKLQKYFSELARADEQIVFDYKSHLLEADFQKLLINTRMKDQIMGHTTVGIHKDDLVFLLHGHPIKKVGSQGQQKSFLIALKLAQFDELTEALNEKPVLLLDDIFDKLDNERVAQLMKLVSANKFGQVLVTDTDEYRVRTIFEKINVPVKIYQVESGKVFEGITLQAQQFG
jgi:DNA replication and repair protein RecF